MTNGETLILYGKAMRAAALMQGVEGVHTIRANVSAGYPLMAYAASVEPFKPDLAAERYAEAATWFSRALETGAALWVDLPARERPGRRAAAVELGWGG